MPIYEYKCDQCGHKMEMLHKISETPDKTCPECSEEALRKLISAVAFKLKGTGWYETDFKDKKPQKEISTSDKKKKEAKKPSDSEKKKSVGSDKKLSPATSSSSSK